MEQRRTTGVIALVAFVALIAGLVYFEAWSTRQAPPQTAFAPAESTDESVPAPEVMAPEVKAPDVAVIAPDAPAPAPDAAAALPPADETLAKAPPATDAPAPAPDATVAAEPPPAAESTGPDVAMVDPAENPPAVAAPIMPGPPVVPTFDVIRVEPSGEAVIAGLAEPEAKVEVLDGPTPLATAEANANGEWALALDKPLPPGAHDLSLRTTSKDEKVATLSDQRVTVSVPEPGSKDVLVVMNTPDAPSKVLQVPGAVPPAAGDQVAAAPPSVEGGEQVAAAPPSVEGGDQVAAAPPSVEGGEQVAAAPPTAVTEPAITAEPPISSEPEVALEAPVTGEAPLKTEPPIATEPEVVAKAEPPLDAPPAAPAPPKPEVAVAAVEADTAGSLYVAGTVTTGETVRVYVDDKPIGDATPSPSGTWLVETKKDMPAGSYKVRADQIDAAGAVIARSEVPFEREVEVAILKPAGTAGDGGEAGATLSGAMPAMETVIIKRGDNLWRIARGAWGKGIRWSTIYEANGDQIRNPHWIYPGQVFIMPKGNAAWTD